MPFPFALFLPACFLAITKARMRGKPFPAYSAWPFIRLQVLSHRFLLFQTEKTMIDKLTGWRNRWVSKPVPSWLRKTGRVGSLFGGGWVHSFLVVAHTIHLPSFYELHSPYNSTPHLLIYPGSSYHQDRNSQYPQNRTKFKSFGHLHTL
jgi:hypothetical protein